jgi:tRNA(His) 5'-end guanylyltransferase
MATMAFNKFFKKQTMVYIGNSMTALDAEDKYIDTVLDKFEIAMFDSRCFNIPVEEVTNCLIWRQQDATRNAIQMLGQCNFSHKELHKKSCNDIQDMLMTQKGINFNDMPTEFKRGVCCRKDENGKWFIDTEIPIFTQDREYIEKCFRMEKTDD